jgi:hypothetical protein
VCALVAVSAAAAEPTAQTLGVKREHRVEALRQERQATRSPARHHWHVHARRLASALPRQLALHRSSTRATARLAIVVSTKLRRLDAHASRRATRRVAALRSAPPRKAICAVFGARHCRDAIAVAYCESRLTTTASNGQYLGLFQMGSTARRTYGHGTSPYAQAKAAHAYFVSSGRDWSPWSCKP